MIRPVWRAMCAGVGGFAQPPVGLLARVGDANAAAPGPAQAPTAGPAQPSDMLVALLCVGTLVLVVWIIRRIVRPSKLLLRDSPGRPNRLHPVAAGLAVVVALLANSLVVSALPLPWWLAGTLAVHLLLIAGGIVLAERTFRGGARRGLGLSGRHLTFDTVRGLVACLAVLPVCVGLLLVMGRILPPEMIRPPLLLEILPELSTSWQVVLVIGTVVTTPIWEEVVFRGLLQSALRGRIGGPWPAIAVSAGLFTMVHNQPQALPALAVLAVVLGYNYERTGRLLAPMLTHALFNAIFIAETLRQPVAGP